MVSDYGICTECLEGCRKIVSRDVEGSGRELTEEYSDCCEAGVWDGSLISYVEHLCLEKNKVHELNRILLEENARLRSMINAA